MTRLETFDIHNDVRWIQILDFRDKNVIDLASWAKAAYSPGGLLRHAQAHSGSFGLKRAWAPANEQPDETARRDAWHHAGRERAFGSGVGLRRSNPRRRGSRPLGFAAPR